MAENDYASRLRKAAERGDDAEMHREAKAMLARIIGDLYEPRITFYPVKKNR